MDALLKIQQHTRYAELLLWGEGGAERERERVNNGLHHFRMYFLSPILSLKQVLHYVEKPGTFVSSTVNAGAYLFTPDIFDYLGRVFTANHQQELM